MRFTVNTKYTVFNGDLPDSQILEILLVFFIREIKNFIKANKIKEKIIL